MWISLDQEINCKQTQKSPSFLYHVFHACSWCLCDGSVVHLEADLELILGSGGRWYHMHKLAMGLALPAGAHLLWLHLGCHGSLRCPRGSVGCDVALYRMTV